MPRMGRPVAGKAKPGGSWTDGFWVGLCWFAYRLTGISRYREWGLEWAVRLRGRENAMTHDIGFLFQYSVILGWQTTGEPMLRQLGLAAADRLVGMWHPTARVIPVGAHAEVASGSHDVTIDCIMNLRCCGGRQASVWPVMKLARSEARNSTGHGSSLLF